MVRPRILELLRSIRHTRIGVLGDFCLDCYWELDPGMPEVSIETGRPTRAVQLQRYTPGGAGNVATNLAALGVGEVMALGVIGDDLFGRELKRLLEERRISLGGLIVQRGGWDTPVYAKPYVGEEEQERIDFGRFNRIAEATEDQILSRVTGAIEHLDALVINQQLGNGICSPRLVEGLNDLACEKQGKVFLLDSRDHRLNFRNMTCKLNAVEAARVCGVQADAGSTVPVGKVMEYARQISVRTGKPVFITRSSEGILAFDISRCWKINGIRIQNPVDPVGAGDTAVAAIAATLAAGGTVEESAVLANLAAGVTVQKLRQTGTASPEEILQMATGYDFQV